MPSQEHQPGEGGTAQEQSGKVKELLAKPDVHEHWENKYRTPANERFFEVAFDYIAAFLKAPPNSTILDIGCGVCAHSIRLANRGFSVQAVDFSETILNDARENIKAKGLDGKIRLQREDVLNLSFDDGTLDYILCWGVLMHIPDVKKAVSEISRVLKPGGTLVISEANMNSLDNSLLRTLKRLLGREKAVVKKTPAGIENWETTPSGTLLTRHADIGWLIDSFADNGLALTKRVAGQLSQSYMRFSSGLPIALIHGLNGVWFKFIKIPQPATGNLIFFQKQE